MKGMIDEFVVTVSSVSLAAVDENTKETCVKVAVATDATCGASNMCQSV